MPLTLAALIGGSAFSQQLSYNAKAGSKHGFQFNIEVDSPDAIRTYKGMTRYTVNGSTAERVQLTYTGGLRESVKYKSSGRSRFGGPPRAMGFPSPFGSSNFLGRTTTTNKISMTPLGSVLSMQGNSQLPYLLGNVSLMPFEALPSTEKDSWSTESGVSITEKGEDRRFPVPSPFYRGGSTNQSVRAAGELSRYSIENEKDGIVTIKKTYQLTMPTTDKKESFEMTGAGQWVFDSKSGMPQSADLRYKLLISSNNATVTVPVHVKYNRLSEEELAKIDADAKRMADERAKKLAEEKAEAERPLTDEERADVLAKLGGSDAAAIVATLTMLSKKSVKDPQEAIIEAIRAHTESDQKATKSAAEKALVAWSSDYKRIVDLKKSYSSLFNLKSTGKTVTALTPLYVGQILQVREHGRYWKAGEIVSLKPDNKVEVAMRWGGRRKRTVSRSDLQLAPDELPQPKKPAVLPTITSETRTWSDKTGKFSIEGTFVRVVQDKIQITRKSDGKLLQIPVEMLSAGDRDYLKSLEKREAEAASPFEVVE